MGNEILNFNLGPMVAGAINNPANTMNNNSSKNP